MIEDAPLPTAAPHWMPGRASSRLWERKEEGRGINVIGRCKLDKRAQFLGYPEPFDYPANTAAANLIEKWWLISRQGGTDGTCFAGYPYKTDSFVSLQVHGSSRTTSLITYIQENVSPGMNELPYRTIVPTEQGKGPYVNTDHVYENNLLQQFFEYALQLPDALSCKDFNKYFINKNFDREKFYLQAFAEVSEQNSTSMSRYANMARLYRM
jgi:hypothetical protein